MVSTRPAWLAHGGRIPSAPTWLIASSATIAWIASALYMIHFGATWHLDLRVYRAAGHELYSGGDPFVGLFTANRLPFTYPPFALLVLSPLALGPLVFIETLWWLLSASALVALLFVLLEAERARSATPGGGHQPPALRRRSLAIAAVIAAVSTLALEPVRSNMNYGQINVLLMLLVVLDCTRARSRWRGVLVGVAAAIKLTPLIYLAFFLVRRDLRAALRGTVTFVLASLVAWAVLPSESARFWFHEATDAKRTGPIGGVSNQSWEGLLNRSPFHSGLPATLAWVVLSLLTLACGLALARRLVAADRSTEAVLALALTELLISPVSWTHHWSWLVIVPIVTASTWRRHRGVAWLLVGLVVLGISAPYWWVPPGAAFDLGSNALVVWGAATLVVWTIAELRDRPVSRSDFRDRPSTALA
jgi:alpha-1,2-mannosyltransferase